MKLRKYKRRGPGRPGGQTRGLFVKIKKVQKARVRGLFGLLYKHITKSRFCQWGKSIYCMFLCEIFSPGKGRNLSKGTEAGFLQRVFQRFSAFPGVFPAFFRRFTGGIFSNSLLAGISPGGVSGGRGARESSLRKISRGDLILTNHKRIVKRKRT